jgi:hypothetical protein
MKRTYTGFPHVSLLHKRKSNIERITEANAILQMLWAHGHGPMVTLVIPFLTLFPVMDIEEGILTWGP